ncbi:hypothetical protein SFR_1396 [Streptomyces sp. FR-008]|nr:hypothetical protein SFR_1396 [Streptomyces sp. FR-008]
MRGEGGPEEKCRKRSVGGEQQPAGVTRQGRSGERSEGD